MYSKFLVDGIPAAATWELVATADGIEGPCDALKWKSPAAKRRYKIEGTSLYSGKMSGFMLIFR